MNIKGVMRIIWKVSKNDTGCECDDKSKLERMAGNDFNIIMIIKGKINTCYRL